MTGYTKIVKEINRFVTKFRKRSLPALEIGQLYDLSPEKGNSKKQAKLKWPDDWANSDRAGVYIFFNEDLNILYIGKASMYNSLGYRLSDYFRYNRKTKRCKIKHSNWSEPPRYVLTVAVPTDMSFEAPALEEYLITKTQPKDNDRGI